MFESELKYIYDIKIPNGINFIHKNEVNKISEFNLLHDIINPPEHTKTFNSHHSTILSRCVNIQNGRAKFKNFRILLDNVCGSTVVIRKLLTKLNPKEEYMMQWHTQAGNITTSLRVKICFNLPELSLTKIVT